MLLVLLILPLEPIFGMGSIVFDFFLDLLSISAMFFGNWLGLLLQISMVCFSEEGHVILYFPYLSLTIKDLTHFLQKV